MRLRLDTNVPGHRCGAEVDAAVLGAAFAQQLLDDRLAELVAPDPSGSTPFERYQIECFDLADRLEATAALVLRVADLFAELDEADKPKAVELFGAVYAPRPEFTGPNALALIAALAGERPDLLAVTIEDGAITDVRRVPEVEPNTSGGVSEASAAGQEAAPDAEASGSGPADPPATNKAGEGGAPAGSGDGAPLTDNPPTASEPSGIAAGASAPAVDPEASESKPAAKPSGAAKAKKSAG